jgi:hypothetical protein
MTNPIRFRLLAGATLLALAIAGAPVCRAAPKSMATSPVVLTAAETEAVAVFEVRLKDYMALHNKFEATLTAVPKKATPEQVEKNQQALSALIKSARAGAKQGEFFTPGMEALVARSMVDALGGPDGDSSKDSIMDDNPGVPQLSVNERYPDAVPLTTMPLRVLTILPKLAEDLEYRFVGQRLVLMDAHAGMIIDFTGDVLP